MPTPRAAALVLSLTLVAPRALAQTPPAATSPAPLQAPNATAAGSTGLTVRPGVEVFAQYALRITNTDTGSDTTHDFDVPRTHASLTGSWQNARARVVLEAVRSASEGSLLGVAGDSLILRLREAYGGWNSPRVDVRAGVVPTLALPEIEATWGLRAVAPTPLETARFVAPADLGVTARVAIPNGLGAVAVGAYNGEGYARREFNRSKSVEAMVILRPFAGGALEPLTAMASYTLGTSGAGDVRADRFTGALLWRGARVRGGATFTYAWGVDDRGDRAAWLAEGFVAAEPVASLLLGARAVRWQRDTGVDTDRVTTIVATAGWRVFRPWEVFLAGTRSIAGARTVQAVPGADHWDLRVVSRVVF
jgi:hypothetical protein